MYDRGEQDVKISIIPEDGRRLITTYKVLSLGCHGRFFCGFILIQRITTTGICCNICIIACHISIDDFRLMTHG